MKAAELLYIDDFTSLAALMKQMRDECEPDIEFHEEILIARMFNCVNDLHREDFNCWVIRYEDRLIAFGVGRMHDFMFSPQKVASLLYWYVAPEYRRKSWAAFHILHTFENWAKLNKAVRIEVGAAKAIGDANKINQMFAKRGFKHYGELFYRDIGV